jgi:hypothetical protein
MAVWAAAARAITSMQIRMPFSGLTDPSAARSRRSRSASLSSFIAALGVVFAVTALVATPAVAASFRPLALVNGWTNVPFDPRDPGFITRNAGVELSSGVVVFEGAIAGGTSPTAFTLPVGFRPATDVYVPVDLCGVNKGRLHITPSGTVDVQAEGGNFAAAQFCTSLEGASFAVTAAGYTPLSLLNGWTNAPFGTSAAAVRLMNGLVQFKGAIAGGTASTVFTLPAGMRPATDVYIPVDLCGANNGRLQITPSGTVDVQEENGTFANAQCFTSLDGASFALSAAGYTPLSLLNGWTNAPFSTSAAAVRVVNGAVQFKGAIAGGTSSLVFTLPAALRPATDVYVPIDLCDANKGRLAIFPSGNVDIEQEDGTGFGNAQCFTSLDGAWFAVDHFQPLRLVNGWTNAPFSTRDAGVELRWGAVVFEGAIIGGSSPLLSGLPVGYRPATDVYIPVDLCNATKGRLHIAPSGRVEVQAEGGDFANAQCFTSLEGASFALSAAGYTPLSLLNGWTNAPLGTSAATVRNVNGVVQFKGAIAGGSSPTVFTLPAGLRPATNVYIPVDLCNANNGRLDITPSGTVEVQAEGGNFANAQCLTSLEGASFAVSAAGYTPLSLLNGWTTPSGTSAAAVRLVNGVVQFKGAIAGGSSPVLFTLPAGLRPATDVYVPVDLCGVSNGRLHITPSGTVEVQEESGNLATAQCFTSLDGAWFAS